MLVIKNLKVSIENKPIVKGVSLEIRPGEIQALMGPNGSGKSTLVKTLAGLDLYQAKGGVALNGRQLLRLSPDKRAKLGLFVSFQEPINISGVKAFHFLKEAYAKLFPQQQLLISPFKELVLKEADKLKLPSDFWEKELNQQFSGGERKRLEMLQALLFKPKYAIFDEIDSGIDLDGLKLMGKAITRLQQQGTGVVLITHHPRILKVIKPAKIHVLVDGQIVRSGNSEILKRLERSGYKSFYCVMCGCQKEECPKHLLCHPEA